MMRSSSRYVAAVPWLVAAGLAAALAQSSAPPSTMDGCSAIVWGATYGLFVRNTTGVPRTPFGQAMWSDFQQAVCRVNWGVFADAPRLSAQVNLLITISLDDSLESNQNLMGEVFAIP
ncbi:hypothetical protein HaLaN_29546, partial [Haematococcus lacustris]